MLYTDGNIISGTSCPAYPTFVVCEPISNTTALTSSVDF